MCGIAGHLGTQNSIGIVLEGLSRLEYRGYDSAGICLKDENNNLKIYKKTGKIENLKNDIKNLSLTTNSCIGHTRWATHGIVSNTNAHPHGNEEVALVHNGIIENSDELKSVLISEGEKFLSETDSEVFLVLVSKYLKQGKTLRNAVSASFKLIKGNSAFVILSKKTDELIGVRRGAPLVCGNDSKNKDLYISSDAYALIGFAENIFFPADEVICHMHKNDQDEYNINFYNLDGEESKKFETKVLNINLDVLDKGGFDHFMLKEINEQPGLIRQTVSYYLHGEGRNKLEQMAHKDIKKFHIIGCGTAWHAGLLIRNFIEKFNKIPCSVELASEFRYRDPLVNKEECGLFISQSGETADTLAAQELCKSKGLHTISLVNVENSSLYRNCHNNILIQAGMEVGVASTKAFTQMVVLGYLYSQAKLNTLSSPIVEKNLVQLANYIELLLAEDQLNKIKHIAESIHHYRGFIFTGRKDYFPVALEGALKLKEIAYVHAEGYAAGELKHGPIALIDEGIVNIALVAPDLIDKTMANIEEVKARKGVIVSIGPDNNRRLKELSQFHVEVPFEKLGDLAPIYVTAVLQLLSYYMAKHKGTDIDKPRNLAKSVTVE